MKKSGKDPARLYTYHLCPNGDHVFSRKSNAKYCPKCGEARYDSMKRPSLKLHIFSLKDRFTRMFAVPELAEAFQYPSRRQPGNGDAWDATLLPDLQRKLRDEQKDSTIFLMMCLDPANFTSWSEMSLLPVCFVCFNLPPSIRSTRAGIILSAIIPPKAKGETFHTWLRPVLDMLVELAPSGRGFRVWDSHLLKYRRIWLQVAVVVNDSRATAPPIKAKQAPAYCGACHKCRVRGLKKFSKNIPTRYPGAVTYLPADHPLRRQHNAEFKGSEHISQLSGAERPTPMTHKQAIKIGQAYETNKIRKEDAAFTGVDEMSSLGILLDKIEQSAYDPAHALGHNIVFLFLLTASKKPMKMTAANIECEAAMGRKFSAPYPWEADRDGVKAVDKSVKSFMVPFPWPKTRKVFDDSSKLKIAETLMLISDVGKYIFTRKALGLSVEFVILHLRFITIMQQMLSKVNGDEDALRELHRQLVVVMTKYEILLPTFISRFVHHELLHICEQLLLLGAFWTHNTFCFERFHVVLKSLAKGSKDIPQSMATAYSFLEPCATSWRFDTHTHTHTNTHTHTHTRTHTHKHIHTHIHTYIHACIHTYTHI